MADFCGVCEKEPAIGGDDPLCVDCRQWVTDNSFEVSDPVERLLSSHLPVTFEDFRVLCICGEDFEGPALHRRHVATFIYEALGLDGPAPWKRVGTDEGSGTSVEGRGDGEGE